MKRACDLPTAFFGVFLFVQSLLAQDPTISNGTCYYGPQKQANSRYIPCGNAALGHFTCCESGDMCLQNNSCYNGRWGVTYLASCSDRLYNDGSCPDKGTFYLEQWTGLSYCNGTSDAWVGCDDSLADSQTVTSAQLCYCPTTSAAVLFGAPSSLSNIVRLPTMIGQSMCDPSFPVCPNSATTPPAALSTSVVSTSSASLASTSRSKTSSSTTLAAYTSAPTSTSATETSAPTSTQSASGLSRGAKVGIGIGSSIGGCLLLGIVACIPLCIRRRKKRRSVTEDATIRPRSQAINAEKDPSEELDQRSPAWSGNMSELAGVERNSASQVSPQSTQGVWSRPTSAEVQGSVPSYQSMEVIRAQALGGVGPAYKPYCKSDVPPVGVHEVSGDSGAAQAVGRPAQRPGSGVFEIPASVPGSTLPY